MKNMRKILAVTVALAVLAACGIAAAEGEPVTLAPVAAEPLTEGIPDGDYEMDILTLGEEAMEVQLYRLDLYEAEAVRNLKTGDKVIINGETYTVSEIADHGEDTFEIIPEEEFYCYLALYPYWAGGYYYVVEDDWTPSTWVADVTLAVPLPESLRYIEIVAGEDIDAGVEYLLKRLGEEDGAGWFNQYNTTATFENDVVSIIMHSDYPMGPEVTE